MRKFNKLVESARFRNDFFEKEILDNSGYNGKDVLVVFKVPVESGGFKFVINEKERDILIKRGYKKTSFYPFKIKTKISIDVTDYQLLFPDENELNGDDGKERFKKIVEVQASRVGNLYQRTLDNMCVGLLNEGRIAAEDETVDYSVPANQVVRLTGGDKWDATSPKPVKNLLDWKKQYAERAKIFPDTIIIGSNVLMLFLKSEEIKKILDNRSITSGTIDVNDMNDKVSYIGRLPFINANIYCHAGIEESTLIFLNKRSTLGLAFGSLNRADVGSYERVFTKFVRNEEEGNGSLVIDSALFVFLQNSEQYLRVRVA